MICRLAPLLVLAACGGSAGPADGATGGTGIVGTFQCMGVEVMTFTGTDTSGTVTDVITQPAGADGCVTIHRSTSMYMFNGSILTVTPVSASSEITMCMDPSRNRPETPEAAGGGTAMAPTTVSASAITFTDYDPDHVCPRIR